MGLCSFMFLSLCFFVHWMDLVLDLGWFCWMRGDSWVCVLIFWSMFCLYCQYVVFDFEFSGCVFIVSILCLILNFLGLYLILNFLGLCLILNFLGKKKTQKFFFYKNHKRSSKWVCSRVFQKRNYRSQPIAVVKKRSYRSDL